MSNAPPVRPVVQHQWCPLEQGLVKVNFDVALFKHKNSAGLSAIVRDWQGANLGALSIPVLLSSTIAELEALACLRAVQFAADLGLQCIIFEGTTIISAVSHGSPVMASFGNIIDDVRHLLPRFSVVSFNHVHRLGNVVAEALAKKASFIVGCHIWMDTLPLDIADLVSFDVH